ncbi:MAG: DegV family EDD domain-containing protein [Nocardioidaceae bacterium]|nr:DegV family EDD domain-containing protein [Nocardioidaceae bacterium]MDQ3324313.1 DegV family EDD domain-containing protein [Actinomycetota bacterium]
MTSQAGSGSPVAIVTDSTACLPGAVVAEHAVSVVPLQVVVGAEVLEEGTDATRDRVAQALRSKEPVSTSRPAPATFAAAYQAAAAAGAEAIVSVHLSAQVSGTYASAAAAAADVGIDVHVVDSTQIGLATGFAVLAAVAARAEGADAVTVAHAARTRSEAAASFFYVDTLEYLRRGGRVGAAAAFFGAALAVKPLLTVRAGSVVPLEKVRTSTRALARIEELAVAAAGSGPVDVGVQHLGVRPRAAKLAERLRGRLPQAGVVWELEVGAVIAAHVGPGAVAVVVSPHTGCAHPGGPE